MTFQNDFSHWLARICGAVAEAGSGKLHQEQPSEVDSAAASLDLLSDHLRRQAHLRRLLALTCIEVVRTSVISVKADQTVGEAVDLLNKHRIKLLPVIDAEKRLIGVVTRTDLEPMQRPVSIVGPKLGRGEGFASERRRLPVGGVMSTAVVSIDAATPLSEIIPNFTSKGHHHLPVVSENNKLLGMLTQSDLVAFMYRNSVF